MKKSFALIAFISTYLFTFGQTNMFWNNYSLFNPAMSAFEFQQHGALTVRENAKWNNGIEIAQANYSQRIYGNHGVGINFQGYYGIFMSNSLNVNYNYQFDFDKAGRLSAGVGIGASQVRLRDAYIDILDSGQVFTPRNNFILNIGVAYSWKNLLVGVATSDLTVANVAYVAPPKYNSVFLNAFASYDFQIKPNFQLTPRINFRTLPTSWGSFTSNLTATFYKKYAVGLSYQPSRQWGLNLGWDISNRFRVAYMFSQTISPANPFIQASYYQTHEFSIGYLIKK